MKRTHWQASLLCLGTLALFTSSNTFADDQPSTEPDGKELFTREWVKDDPRSVAGDGLGPLFNERSCVACHNQGGIGGAGDNSKNVDLVSHFRNDAPRSIDEAAEPLTEKQKADQEKQLSKYHPEFPARDSVVVHKSGPTQQFRAWRNRLVNLWPPLPEPGLQDSGMSNSSQSLINELNQSIAQDQLAFARRLLDENRFDAAKAVALRVQKMDLVYRLFDDRPNHILRSIAEQRKKNPNPAKSTEPQSAPRWVLTFRPNPNAPTLDEIAERVLVRRMLDDEEPTRDRGIACIVGNLFLAHSQRNTSPLFGVGLIDSIPDSVIKQSAKLASIENPRISGRAPQLANGRIGRFGWKAQIASLRDFTMTACAVEIGLTVPGHSQTSLPLSKDVTNAGLDMNDEQCDALISYVRGLPVPSRRMPILKRHAQDIADGERHFTNIGCAACHRRKLGNVDGIYTDLVLHDMGETLAGMGGYSSRDDNADFVNEETPKESENAVASPREWRTPPLWGCRDSAPYLHDGRAETLRQAIAFHEGESLEARRNFLFLSREEQEQVLSFLRSLVAPTTE